MNDDDPPITGSKVVVGESEAVKEVYKQLRGSVVGWRLSKETEKVVKKLAKKLGITERAVIRLSSGGHPLGSGILGSRPLPLSGIPLHLSPFAL
jgi:hypothetical protein